MTLRVDYCDLADSGKWVSLKKRVERLTRRVLALQQFKPTFSMGYIAPCLYGDRSNLRLCPRDSSARGRKLRLYCNA